MRVSLEGNCTIGRAAQLRESLLQALSAGENIELDFQGVTEMDLSFCQLIHALRVSCQKQGLACDMLPNLPPELIPTAQHCGLPDFGAQTGEAASGVGGAP